MPIRGELGSYPTDYEPYFERWDCVMWYANPTARIGVEGVVPCFRHKTCGKLIKAFDIKPPRVCTHCGTDTVDEVKEHVEISTRSGAPLDLTALVKGKE